MNAIYILWLRQLKRYFRSKSRVLGSLGQPLLFLITFDFGFGSTFQKAGEGNYLQFLAPGIIAMSVLFSAIFFGIEVIFDKQFGFLKETLVAPVSRVSIMVGRTLGGATVATLQGVVVLLISYAFGFRMQNIYLLPLALLFMFLMALLFTGLGTAIASKMDDMHGFQLIMNFLVMPLFFLSGSLFPIQGLPPALKIVTSLNPLTYGIDGLRGSLIGISQLSFYFDLLIVGLLTTIVLVIGSYLFSRIQL